MGHTVVLIEPDPINLDMQVRVVGSDDPACAAWKAMVEAARATGWEHPPTDFNALVVFEGELCGHVVTPQQFRVNIGDTLDEDSYLGILDYFGEEFLVDNFYPCECGTIFPVTVDRCPRCECKIGEDGFTRRMA